MAQGCWPRHCSSMMINCISSSSRPGNGLRGQDSFAVAAMAVAWSITVQ